MVAFGGANVVVTGGTGALGTAVVTRLRMAGAVCHVTNFVAAELETYAHRNDPAVHVHTGLDLADEAAVQKFYDALPPLWASLPPENRRRLSQIMARVIAQHRLPRQKEVPDD